MQKWQPTNSENCQFSNYQKIERRVGEKAGTANVRRQFGEKKTKKIDIFYVFFFSGSVGRDTHNIHFRIFFSHQMNFYSVGILQHKEWAVDP